MDSTFVNMFLFFCFTWIEAKRSHQYTALGAKMRKFGNNYTAINPARISILAYLLMMVGLKSHNNYRKRFF